MFLKLAKKRSCIKEKNLNKIAKQSKRISIPITKEEYKNKFSHTEFREKLDEIVKKYVELFPEDISGGYRFHDIRQCKKINIKLRRIKLKTNGEVYTIMPSTIMPYITAEVSEVEDPLFLRSFGVPYWALTRLYGRNDMFWYRIENSIGRNSIVGTTIRRKEKLPKHLLADEKFSKEKRKRIYIAMTSSDDCVLGASITDKADQEALEQSYGIFKKEILNIDANYQPVTTTTDGWSATRLSWQKLFNKVQLILCFLHSFLKIRDKCRLLLDYPLISSAVWEAYRCKKVEDFQEKIYRLYHQAKIYVDSKVALASIRKLYNNRLILSQSYSYPGCYRTTARLDRLMDHADRFLYSLRYFHGHRLSSERSIRAWAILNNFSPYSPSSHSYKSYSSPAHKINGFVYHNSWLQNLLVSSSLGGFRSSPQNPLG